MSKARINQQTRERCLLTEIAPDETPTLFSNWGSYNFCRVISGKAQPPFLAKLFSPVKLSVPFKYPIKKDGIDIRTLSLIHPHHSAAVIAFYEKYNIAIVRACKRSQFSLRAPHHVAKFYTLGRGIALDERQIEDITAETAYASSYFAYNRYSHLHKFFDSDDFTELEKRFAHMSHLDIAKFFPSLYTHSISWAVRGKTQTKKHLFGPENPKKAFDSVFDTLLQRLNYRETHGIPIGPELCRIFSEIILQKVDAAVTAKLKTKRIALGKDLWCYRYIDDYFVFYNDEAVRTQFVIILCEELEKFKLFLNSTKHQATPRPFISPLSILKIEISRFLRDLFDRREELDSHDSSREIDKLRALTKNADSPFSSVSGYLLGSLSRQITMLFATPPQNLFGALYVYLDLSFHAFRMDIRVASSFKITTILLDVLRKLSRLLPSDRAKITDKIVFEMRGAVESAIYQGCSVECMNLVIANALFSDKYPLPVSLIESCIERLRERHNDEYSFVPRLTYFEIVSLLYYFADIPDYANHKVTVLRDAETAIKSHDPCEHAETAYLLLDLVSCPFLSVDQKDVLIRCGMSHGSSSPSAADVGRFRIFVSGYSWYFNWSRHEKMRVHLKKKQLLLAY